MLYNIVFVMLVLMYNNKILIIKCIILFFKNKDLSCLFIVLR